MAKIDMPEGTKVQGRSFVPLMQGQDKGWRKSLYYTYYEYGEHRVPQHFGVRTDQHKLMYFPRTNEWNLFDLKADPTEMKSVYDEKGYEKIRKRLTSEFNRLRKHYEAPEFD